MAERQMRRIRKGFLPYEQEQRWFIWYDEGVLHLHRSWTGYTVFEVPFERTPAGWLAREARVNQDPEQYLETDPDEQRRLVRMVIRSYLLDAAEDEPVPSPEEVAAAPAEQGGPR